MENNQAITGNWVAYERRMDIVTHQTLSVRRLAKGGTSADLTWAIRNATRGLILINAFSQLKRKNYYLFDRENRQLVYINTNKPTDSVYLGKNIKNADKYIDHCFTILENNIVQVKGKFTLEFFDERRRKRNITYANKNDILY